MHSYCGFSSDVSNTMNYFVVIFLTLQLWTASGMSGENYTLYLSVSQEVNGNEGYMHFTESAIYKGLLSNTSILNFQCTDRNEKSHSLSPLYWEDSSNFRSGAFTDPVYLTVYLDAAEHLNSVTCVDTSKSKSITLNITSENHVIKRSGVIATENIEFYPEGSRIVTPEWCNGTVLYPSGATVHVYPGDVITDYVTENINWAKLLCVSYNRMARTDQAQWERRVHYKVTYFMANYEDLMKHRYPYILIILLSIILVLALILLSLISYLCSKRWTSKKDILSPPSENQQPMYREVVWRTEGTHGFRESEHLYWKIPAQTSEHGTSSMRRLPPLPGENVNSSTANLLL